MRMILLTSAAFLVGACIRTGGDDQGSHTGGGRPCLCGGASQAHEEAMGGPEEGGTVSIRISSEPGTLLSMYSPHEVIGNIIDHDVLEALVTLNESTGEPLPELAMSWEVDEPTGTYTFHLDTEAKWHDGEAFTGRDVEFTFDLLMDPAGGAIDRNSFLDVESVEYLDQDTVVFRLDRARPDFVPSLSRVAILPEHVFGKDVVPGHPAAQAPIGTGPFTFAEWKRGLSITLKANPDWRGRPPHVDEVVYRVVPERRVAMDLFRGGELDMVTDSGPLSRKVSTEGRLITYPMSRFEGLVYNVSRPIFQDPVVRRAIGSLIDRDAIRCSIRGCLAELIDGPWPASSAMAKEVPSMLTYDPTGARRALDEAGWKDRDEDGIREKNGMLLSFSVLLLDSERDLRRAMTVMQWDFARAGVEVRIVPMGRAVYSDRLMQHRFDAAMIVAPNHHPFDPWPYFHTAGALTGRNYGVFSDPVVDGLIEELSEETVPTARRALVYELNRSLAMEQPISFTFRPFGSAVVRNTVKGVRIRDEWFEERDLWIRRPGDEE